jgi:hypothetical protein
MLRSAERFHSLQLGRVTIGAPAPGTRDLLGEVAKRSELGTVLLLGRELHRAVTADYDDDEEGEQAEEEAGA